MKHLFALFFISLFSASSTLSQEDFSSRLKKYQLEPNWSIKSEMIIDLCLESESINFGTVKKEAKKMLEKGELMSNESYVNSSRFVIAFILNKEGKYDQALELFFLCERYFEHLEDNRNIAYVKVAKGHSYYYKGMQREAISQYKSAKLVWESIGDKMEVNQSESLIANSLIQLKEYEKAETILKKCIAFIVSTKKYRTISAYYSQLAELYSTTKEIEKSRYNFAKGAEFALRSNDPGTIARAQNYLAIAEYYEGNVEKAIELFESSLEYREKSGEYKLVCESYYNIASLYLEEKNYEKAKKYFLLSGDEAQKHNILKDQADALMELSNVSKIENDFPKALDYLMQHLEINVKIKSQFTKEFDKETEVLNQLNKSAFKIKLAERERRLAEEIQFERGQGKITFYVSLCVLLAMVIYILKLKSKKI